jgi:hypothetical protein
MAVEQAETQLRVVEPIEEQEEEEVTGGISVHLSLE